MQIVDQTIISIHHLFFIIIHSNNWPTAILLYKTNSLYLGMATYRLDRTAFKAHTAEEATKSQAAYYKTLTWQERLRAANYLNSVAYNYPEDQPPKLDRSAFSMRSRLNEND